MPDVRPDARAAGPSTTGAGRPLDATDRVLLDRLQADARCSWAELARAVGLSAPSVQDRVRRLEERGVITGFHARLGAAAVDLGLSALVAVELSESADPDAVAADLALVEQIEDAWFVAGDQTYILKVRVADVPGLSPVLVALRSIPGVGRTRTTVVLATLWEGRPRRMSED
jgi:Lrp/AsnC family leucine-responsive transcriptional regulator